MGRQGITAGWLGMHLQLNGLKVPKVLLPVRVVIA